MAFRELFRAFRQFGYITIKKFLKAQNEFKPTDSRGLGCWIIRGLFWSNSDKKG